MKYIRTQDGIFETIDYDQLPDNLKKQLDEREHSCMKDYKNIGVFIKLKRGADIISNIQPILLFAVEKQADTIEELCDYFVAVDENDNEHFIDRGFNFLKSCVNNDKDRVYGAIWTDKGLIYIAKMNDKGELELL